MGKQHTRDEVQRLIYALPVAEQAAILDELQRSATQGKAPKRGAPEVIPFEDAAFFKLCLRLRRDFIKLNKLRETPRTSMMIVAVYCKIDTDDDDGRVLARLVQISSSRDSKVNQRATARKNELSSEARAQLSKQIAALRRPSNKSA